MKRILLLIAAAAVAVAAFISIAAVGGGGDPYLVRAAFDTAGYVVNGEDVRINGANVGTIDSVTVAQPGELISEQGGHLVPAPGKAIVVLRIDNPAFQDFRSDATCQIRQQALIGEKFVDCRPTLPRAPGSPPPPPLHRVPDGQPGAGQYLIPLQQDGTSVEPDLVNDILRQPYAERFRLILNDLGAGFAGQGENLQEIIRRGNPTLRDTDTVLNILASQRRQLTQLTADSDQILQPLANQREHVAGFFTNAGIAAQATAERGPQLEADFARFPRFLAELRSTMASLQSFSTGAEPVMVDFNRSATQLTTATRRLTPFLGNSITALRSLADVSAPVGSNLVASEPLLNDLNDVAQTGQTPLANGSAFLNSLRTHKGFENLMDLIYNTNASVNGFDSFGHTLRSVVQPTNCVDYSPLNFTGCSAKYHPSQTKKKKKKHKKKKGKKAQVAATGAVGNSPDQGATGTTTTTPAPLGSPVTPPTPPDTRVTDDLLNFLLGR
jgi:phospholipid/cholesterol/gamma-HCH transport system substrate-binding protein